MQTTPSMNWGRERSPRPCTPRNERKFPRIRSLLHVAPTSQNDQPQRIERKLLAQIVRTDGQSLSHSLSVARFLNSYVPPRKEYCFRQNGFIGEMQCSRPKLVNGSENRCSFIFDEKYDELRRFRLTRVTAYGMNVFRRFVKYLPGKKPLKRASANLHLNFPFENIDNRMRIMPVDRVDGSWGVIDSNEFNLFTWCFRKLFRKERIHLLGMRCRGKSEGKDKYREYELLHAIHRFCPLRSLVRDA